MWVINVILLLMWFFNPSEYKEMKAAGYACYGWVGTDAPTTPAPECFYDPPEAARALGRR